MMSQTRAHQQCNTQRAMAAMPITERAARCTHEGDRTWREQQGSAGD
jgi:hypothetical protein